jgi:hypothetical protein
VRISAFYQTYTCDLWYFLYIFCRLPSMRPCNQWTQHTECRGMFSILPQKTFSLQINQLQSEKTSTSF